MSWRIGEHRYPQIATFWEIKEEKDNFCVVSLTTSKKDKNENWHNSPWGYCRFVGKACEGLSNLSPKDRIEIKAGEISREKYIDKDGNEVYPKNPSIVVYAWEIYDPKGNASSNLDEAPKVENDNDMPF